MIPLGKVYKTGDELKEVEKTLNSGWWAGCGPTTKELEKVIGEYLKLPDDYKVCVVANGTVALELCHRYLNQKNKWDCIVPSYSFVATAFAVNHAGGDVVFADVDENGYNLSLDTIKNAYNITTGFLSPVHQYGIPCDIEAINAFAEEKGLKIVEDAACAFGSKWKDKFIGTHGNLTCFSLQARKTATCGEGGFIVIPPGIDAEWFFTTRSFGMSRSAFDRTNSKNETFEYERIGFNYKLGDIAAAVAIAQVRHYDTILKLREDTAMRYIRALKDMEEVTLMKIPVECDTNWQNFRILVDPVHRDPLISFMKSREIFAKKCIQPIHLEKPYRERAISLPKTEQVSKAGIWLPFYANMGDDLHVVVNSIKDYFHVNT